MKSSKRTILEFALRVLTRWTITRYAPDVVGITGSVGKTSTKEAIACVLRGHKSLRAAQGNLNNEVGLPLAVLSSRSAPRGIGGWGAVIVSAVGGLIMRRPYPDLLVLEYAADKPGDISYLTRMVRPRVAVVTAVGDVPVHVEQYPSVEAVGREKAKLIEVVPSSGFAILSYDDPQVWAMKEKTRARVIGYGFGEGAEVRVSGFEERLNEEGIPVGISFKLEYGGSFVPVRMDRVIGKAPAYAAAAAAAVGIAFGLHLVKIAESLSYYEQPAHRMCAVKGLHDTLVIDDTYNASPLSMREAVAVAGRMPQKRKVAILGDMRELGKFSVPAHEALGKEAAEVFDVVCTVGELAHFIGEAAGKAKRSKKMIFSFADVEEAIEGIAPLLHKGDLVLVKGSHALELERLVEKLVYS